MRIHKLYIIVGLMIAFGMLFELTAHADESNESTNITFSAPIEVPGQVLPAGTYTLQQADPVADGNVIRVLNADGIVVATIQTIAAERAYATGATAITLAEPESGQPDFLVKWFYPGRITGHEFVYPKPQEQEIARSAQETFVGNGSMTSVAVAGE